MKRVGFSVLLLVGVAACAPTVPESGAGVGFEGYGGYQTQRVERDQQLAGETTVRPPRRPNTVEIEQVAGPAPQQATNIEQVAGAAIDQADAAQAAPIVVTTNNPGISDEQDFSVVSERESIESDRERLQAQRQTYEVIAPTALPQRSGSGGPNIVEYALGTTNLPGQPVYRRSSLRGGSERACAQFASPDLAQEAFLKAGGPDRDRKNLDPDGDGFACGWDPRPFRLAKN